MLMSQYQNDGLGFEFASTASGAASGASAGASFGPWGAAIGGAIGGLASIFGGKKGPTRAQKTQMAVSQGQQRIANLTLESAIQKIEAFLAGTTTFFDCNPNAKSTEFRSCYFAACDVARKLGYAGSFADCDVYMKRPFEAASSELTAFFRSKLPELKAMLNQPPATVAVPLPQGPVVTVPSTTGTQPMQPYYPQYTPSPIVVGPSQPQQPVSAGMDPWMIAAIVGIGVLALTNRR